MSETETEFTYAEVSAHNSKKDLHVVIHDKVYNTTSFIDEHPGGEEVMLDVGGQDATEAFEDVGHSDEAREILDGMLVGKLRRVAGDPEVKSSTTSAMSSSSSSGGAGFGMYIIIAVGAVAALGVYQYMASNKDK